MSPPLFVVINPGLWLIYSFRQGFVKSRQLPSYMLGRTSVVDKPPFMGFEARLTILHFFSHFILPQE
jgi:hypothetical protein